MSTIPASRWLAEAEAASETGGPVETSSAWRDFLEATYAFMHHEFYDGDLREPPVVAYDALADTHYFIFKQDNNGTTFVVSRYPMKGLDDGDYGRVYGAGR